ncbi:MAG TPA: AraC family transcriptional regulator [Burkholderiales bacterium]|jgi:AraC-like DNA-binding protein|nr:AraC family transcriptional regulator [Burkholderiales bacterium]
MTPTSLATLGQIVANVLKMYGLDAPVMFERHGIDPALLGNPNARIPSRAWDSLALDAAAHIPDPAFGLRAARCWHPSNLGALGYAWLTSSTLRTGLERVVRYWRLLGEASSTRLAESSAGLTFLLARQAPDPVSSAIAADFVMSLLVDMCRMNAGSSLRPVAVRLRRMQPKESEGYRRHFGCVVHFAAGEDSFTLSRRDADRPLPTSNRQLAATLDRILTEQLAHVDKNDVVARCQAHLLEQLCSGEVSEDLMAKQLHMSRRTLQRKLADADLTYQKLVDDTRRDLAMRHLEDPRYSVTDVTFLLGFSQQSAFTRAFKRWAGMSPSEYRAQRSMTV